ncbi:hypothetical protein BC628DRAFT_870133 [Trametes gibbosa]|nr:hypothetical protein BC628DRAFT_870133 [Trametes gibbosa]
MELTSILLPPTHNNNNSLRTTVCAPRRGSRQSRAHPNTRTSRRITLSTPTYRPTGPATSGSRMSCNTQTSARERGRPRKFAQPAAPSDIGGRGRNEPFQSSGRHREIECRGLPAGACAQRCPLRKFSSHQARAIRRTDSTVRARAVESPL